MIETNTEKQPDFEMLKVYIKDLSFEAPTSLRVSPEDLRSEVNVDFNVVSQAIAEEDTYEVILKVVVTSKIQEKVLFLIELSQAGLFLLKNIPEEEMGVILNALCPSLLFPDVREMISSLTIRGGFPSLYLKPVNFEAVYEQQLETEACCSGKQA
jgi:preprotein translocase subunit SecB